VVENSGNITFGELWISSPVYGSLKGDGY